MILRSISGHIPIVFLFAFIIVFVLVHVFVLVFLLVFAAVLVFVFGGGMQVVRSISGPVPMSSLPVVVKLT